MQNEVEIIPNSILGIWFHGGVRDFKPGDVLLPPSETGNPTLLKYAERVESGIQRADRVYITTDADAAAMFASVYPYGDVYRVEPLGEIEPDPDCVPWLSRQCERAVVVEVVRKRVSPVLRFNKPTRRRR